MKRSSPYYKAVSDLAAKVPQLVPFFDRRGHLRTLLTESDGGLLPNFKFETPLLQAQSFLSQPEVRGGLGVDSLELFSPTVVEFPSFGWRVSHQQHVAFEGRQVPVLNGIINTFVGKNGNVFKLDSTLQHGEQDPELKSSEFRAATEQQAIDVATRSLKLDGVEKARAEFWFAEHNKRLEPVWRVVVTAAKRVRVVEVLVKATTGRVIGSPRELLRHARTRRGFRRQGPAPASVQEAVFQAFDQDISALGNFDMDARRRRGGGSTASGGNKKVPGKGLLTIPDPNKDIVKQVYDIVLESLPDPQVLSNDNFAMYIGNSHDPVKAKSDGTFNYMPNEKAFSAVVTFFVLNIQWELMKLWGMPKGTKQIPVRVEDRTTSDNASFDSENWEIRIGVGSGTRWGGLTRYIAYDFGVSLHENGHHLVYVCAPGKDLPGDEGGAIHEAVGDVQGTLLICWWLKHKLGNVLKINLTAADIAAEDRKVGTYAMPPDGIRQQKNKAKPPLSGEVHEDSLIIGGAMADLLVALVQKHGVQTGLETFGKLTIAALGSVPSNKVTFRDLLTAYRSQDQQMNAKANWTEITDCFSAHGIKLNNARRRNGSSPMIIIE